MKTLLVISNHLRDGWSKEQKEGWDRIIFQPFPNVENSLSTEEMRKIANKVVDGISIYTIHVV